MLDKDLKKIYFYVFMFLDTPDLETKAADLPDINL